MEGTTLSEHREQQLFRLLDCLDDRRTRILIDYRQHLEKDGRIEEQETDYRDCLRIQEKILMRLGLHWDQP